MYIRIVNAKFASEIEADAMHAFAEHELINKLPGILSVENVRISNLHSIVINKFDSQESAEKGPNSVKHFFIGDAAEHGSQHDYFVFDCQVGDCSPAGDFQLENLVKERRTFHAVSRQI